MSNELKEIRDGLTEVKVDIGSLSTKVDMHTEQVTQMLQKHDETLHHNPHGLVLTVDRLAQTQKKRTWVMRIIGGTIATIFIKFVWDFFVF